MPLQRKLPAEGWQRKFRVFKAFYSAFYACTGRRPAALLTADYARIVRRPAALFMPAPAQGGLPFLQQLTFETAEGPLRFLP